MSLADELLDGVGMTTMAADAVDGTNFVIGSDRFIVIPEALKKIGVQYDHNIETITFDCPRYWDGRDLSEMYVYINYMRPDGELGCHLCENVRVDDGDGTLMHFDWTISGHVTYVKGNLNFLVCIKKEDSEGNQVNHWNSELNSDLYISAGLECDEQVVEQYPDIISHVLTQMEYIDTVTSERVAHMDEMISEFDTNVVQAVTNSAAAAAGSATEAEGHADDAEASANAAAQSATAAANSADVAESRMNHAGGYATDAATSEANAETYKNLAKGYSETAAAKATEASDAATAAGNSADNAETSEVNAEASALESKSWAVGGTGTREGEDTNNAKYWSEQAQAAVGGGVITFNGRSGSVVPEEGDYTPDMVGAISAEEKGIAGGVASLGEDGKVPAEQLPEFTSGDYIPVEEKGAAGGVATLGEDGKVPADQVNAANVETLTTAEFEALPEKDANTLYMLTDAEDDPIGSVGIDDNDEPIDGTVLTNAECLDGVYPEGFVYLSDDATEGTGVSLEDKAGNVLTPRTDAKAVSFDDTNVEDALSEVIARPIVPRKNLLDNPRFKVNQQGLTSYTLSANQYFVDRWAAAGGSSINVTVDDGISLCDDTSGYQIAQWLLCYEDIVGKVVTISMLTQDGALFTISTQIPLSEPSSVTNFILLYFNGTGNVKLQYNVDIEPQLGICISNSVGVTTSIKAIKLEIGEGQTLAYKDENGAWQLYDDYDYDSDLASCTFNHFQIEGGYLGNEYVNGIGAAPAGYGLGLNLAKSITNLDLAVESGWYASAGAENAPEGMTYGNLFVSARGSVIRQDYFASIGTSWPHLVRYINNGITTPWEWVNPLMAIGVEYRTTERYQGRPVYWKLINFGNMPNNTVKSVEYSTDTACRPILTHGTWENDLATLPCLNGTESSQLIEVRARQNNVFIYTYTDRSSHTAKMFVKYWKTTD